MASLGINLGRMSNGMGAFGLMMAASRLFSFGHSSHSTTESMENGEHTGNSEAMGTSSGMGDGAGPIPMSTGNPMDMEEMGEDYVSGNPLEEGYADNADDGKTADTVSDQEKYSGRNGNYFTARRYEKIQKLVQKIMDLEKAVNW